MRQPPPSQEKGAAMFLAVTAAIIVSLTAVVVLGLATRRFHMAAFQLDHAAAFSTSEAGIQYAFARLERDTTYTDSNFPGVTGFANVVIAASAPPGSVGYVVSPLAVGTVVQPHNYPQSFTIDEQDTALQTGNRNVLVVIVEDPPGGVPPRFRVRAFSDYATQ